MRIPTKEILKLKRAFEFVIYQNRSVNLGAKIDFINVKIGIEEKFYSLTHMNYYLNLFILISIYFSIQTA